MTKSDLPIKNRYTIEDMIRAFVAAAKHKSNKPYVQKFEMMYVYAITTLLDDINSGMYQISPSITFAVTWPKIREVWASDFIDRIVHHLICDDLAAYYHKRFIHTNCACIPGKGTDFAIRYANKYARSITQDWTVPAYALKFDVSNFFVTIDKNILWSILSKDLGEDSLTMQLLKQILFKDPTDHAIIINKQKLKKVPPHKTLWNTDIAHGLPIGDLPSQLCASGIYMDGLDKFIKHKLKCKYYIRYVDDGIIFDTDIHRLRLISIRINRWLRIHRKLKLSTSKTKIVKVLNGFDFVGAHILPYRIHIRNSTIHKTKLAFAKIRRHPTKMSYIASVNSYLGMMMHRNSFNLRKRLCSELLMLYPELNFDKDYTKLYFSKYMDHRDTYIANLYSFHYS